jgi:hypothetical protein
MKRIARIVLRLAGCLAAVLWVVVFLSTPRVAMELLVLASPVVCAAWLILTLSARRPSRRVVAGSPEQVNVDAVIARDGGVCAQCGTGGARAVATRRPARPSDQSQIDRFITLCAGCASTTPLPKTRSGFDPVGRA